MRKVEKVPVRRPIIPSSIDVGKKISYADLEHSVSRFANALLALGRQPADKVALLLPNIPNIVIADYGIWRMGAVPPPYPPIWMTMAP